MKRLWILCALLLCLAGTAAAEETLAGNLFDLDARDDQLYATTQTGVYRLDGELWTEQKDVRPRPMNGMGVLPQAADFTDEGVYLLMSVVDYQDDSARWALYRSDYTAEGLSASQQLYLLDLPADTLATAVASGFEVLDGYAYFLLPLEGTWNQTVLYRVSLADGRLTRMTEDYLCDLQTWQGRLMAVYSNWDVRRPEGGFYPSRFASIDLDTGAVTLLEEMTGADCRGLVTDEASGHLYVHNGSEIYRYDASLRNPILMGYMNTGYAGARQTLWQGHYVYDNSLVDTVVARIPLQENPQPRPLIRIMSSMRWGDPTDVQAYAQAHPELRIEFSDTIMTTAEYISRSMTDPTAACDIYALTLSDGVFSLLKDKGYLLDLSAHPALAQAVSQMHPRLTAPLTENGGLWGVPVAVSASMPGYSVEALEKLGLTADDMPRTLMELLDFIQLWDEEYADLGVNQLFGGVRDLYDSLRNLIFEMQVHHCEREGVDLTFSTPAMRALLQRLEELRPVIERIHPQRADYIQTSYVLAPGDALFYLDASPLPPRYNRAAPVPLMLRLDEQTEAWIPVSLTALVVNPASDNPNEAMDLIAYLCQAMQEHQKFVLLPEMNDPIEDAFYPEALEFAQSWVAEAQTILEEAKAMDISDLRDFTRQLREREMELERIQAARWAFDAQQVADFRANDHLLFAPTTGLYSDHMLQLRTSSALERYLDRQLSLDQLLREFERMLQMMRLEGL